MWHSLMVARKTIPASLENTVATRPQSKWQKITCPLKSFQTDLNIPLCLLSRPFITSGNVLLVQFVSDLSVTSDGFLAHYTSVPHGSQVSTKDVGAGTRYTSPNSAGKPAVPKRPAPTLPPPATTVKYEPTEKPKLVKPTRGRGQGTTGPNRRVPGTGPNGKRPGGWSYVHSVLV